MAIVRAVDDKGSSGNRQHPVAAAAAVVVTGLLLLLLPLERLPQESASAAAATREHGDMINSRCHVKRKAIYSRLSLIVRLLRQTRGQLCPVASARAYER